MNRIRLRNLLEGDRANVYDLLFEPSVMSFLGPGRSLSSNEAKEWFESEFEFPSRFVVASKENNELMGFCVVKEIDRILDFGYFLRKKYWGNGYATEACTLALDKFAGEIDLNSIEIFIANNNSASRGVAKKLDWTEIKKITKNGEKGSLFAVNMFKGKGERSS